MLKTILISLLLWYGISIAVAQQGAVKGTVKDAADSQPMRYASVSLIAEGGNVIEGQLTDSLGTFLFSRIRAGVYTVSFKFLGYDHAYTDSVVVGAKVVDVGTVFLRAADQFLDTVEVTGRRAPQEHRLDRQTYNAAQFQQTVGGTALDVVKNLPAISVDGQGQISLRGASGVLVLINDKPVVLDPVTFLSQIAANDILEVEFITNPSARYDPDGKGGILNIKTKKASQAGVSWIVNVQGGLPSIHDYGNKEAQQRYGGDLSVFYQRDKVDFSLALNYLRNDNAGFRDGDVNTIIDNRQTFFPSAGERSFDKYNYGLRMNTAYKPAADQNISIGVLANRRYQDRLADIYYDNRTVDLTSGSQIGGMSYFNSNLQNKQGEFYLIDLAYKLNVGMHNLGLGVVYEHANIYGGTDNLNIVQADTIQYVKNTYRNPLNGLRVDVSDEVSLDGGKLTYGYQFRTDEQRGTFLYKEQEGGTSVVVPAFSGRLNASNHVQGVYAQYEFTRRALTASIGARYEYYRRLLYLRDIDTHHRYQTHQIYPSLSLMYDMGNDWAWKASAGRRVQRTNNFELNPIPEREHSETLEQGDPNLLPEFISTAETGLVKNMANMSLFANIYFQHVKNPIQRTNSVYNDTILNRLFTNAERATRWGLELGGQAKPLTWLQLNLGGNLYRYAVSGLSFGNQNESGNADLVFSFNAGAQLAFLPTWNLSANINYLSNRPTVQGWDSRFVTPHLALKKSFYKNAVYVLLQWQNLELGTWGVNEQRITTSGSDFFTTTNYVYEKNILLLNVNFNLNRINQLLKLPKSEFGEKEF